MSASRASHGCFATGGTDRSLLAIAVGMPCSAVGKGISRIDPTDEYPFPVVLSAQLAHGVGAAVLTVGEHLQVAAGRGTCALDLHTGGGGNVLKVVLRDQRDDIVELRPSLR